MTTPSTPLQRRQKLRGGAIVLSVIVLIAFIWGARSSSQSTPTKDDRRIAMETAACTASLAGTTRYIGYGCYEYCNGKQREKKDGCSDSPDNSQDRSEQPCVGLPANAQRNGADNIDQVWNGSERYPTTTGRYNEGVSNGECTFSCLGGYDWMENNCVLSNVITHDPNAGTISITNGTTTYTIMDRNLGATQAGTGSTSYGNYYQRGNNYGFANAGTVTPNSTGLVSGATRPYSSGTWIYGSSDRASPQNDNLRGGSTSDGPTTIPTNTTERQGPCATGYHVPSQGERNQLLIVWASANGVTLNDSSGYKYFSSDITNATKFRNDFLLPLAGNRYYSSASSVSYQGANGYYWSSSPFSTSARILFLDTSDVRASNASTRAHGLSLRCFKDS